MRKIKSIASIISGMAGLGIQGAAHAAPVSYSSEILGDRVSVIDMNDRGDIIGSQGGSVYHWSYDELGNLKKDLLPFAQTEVFDINNRGELLTRSGLYNTESKTLAKYANAPLGSGFGQVNDKGEIVIGAGVQLLTDPSASVVRIASGKIMPAAFNNNGIAVDSDGGIWDVVSRQKVGVKPPSLGYSYVANDLNDKNQILFSTSYDSYLYGLDGKNTSLGLLGYDLDNFGNVVGSKLTVDGRASAVIWRSKEKAIFNLSDYLTKGASLVSASHVNDKGWIVAQDKTGVSYLLKPVPLPASGILFLSSIFGFLALQRKRLKIFLKPIFG